MNLRPLSHLAALCLFACASCTKETPAPSAPSMPAPSAPVAVQPAPEAAAFKVESVTLGNAIDADKRVADPKTTFFQKDRIYASVATIGVSPSVALKAVWTFKGEKGDVPVAQKEMTIAPTGRALTAFDVENAAGWPLGAYSVEIFANGVAASKTEFIVSH